MPYYIYQISPPKKLKLLQEFAAYQEARAFAREQRQRPELDKEIIIKMIFAPNPAQAEVLLATEREPRPLGEDA